MKTRKIAYFELITHFGGAQQASVDLAVRLASDNHHITVFDAFGCCDPFAERLAGTPVDYMILCPNTKITTYGFTKLPLWRWMRILKSVPEMAILIRRLRKRFKESQPDVIWVSSFKGATIAAYASRGLGIPILYYVHWWEVSERILNLAVFNRIGGFIALADSIRETLLRQGLPKEKVFVCHNAFDPEVLEYKAERPLESPLPDLGKPTRILLLGTLVPRKGQIKAIRALALIAEEIDAVLYLAGDTPQNSKSAITYREEILATIRETGMEQRVHLLGWRNDVPQLIRHSTMLVLPSSAEGLPLCLMEAMALGCPVAATPIAGIPDLLYGGKAGWLIDMEDPKSLAQAIRNAHSGAPSIQEITNIAKSLIAGKFSIENQKNQFLQVVDTLMERNTRAENR